MEERVNSFGSRPIMLRLGSNEHRRALASYLSALLGAKATQEDRDSYERNLDTHRSLLSEMERHSKRLERMVSLRNQTDRLEQGVESIRNALGEPGFKVLRDISHKDAERVRAAALEVRKSLERANKGSQSLLIQLCWPLIRGTREREPAAAMQEVRLASSKLHLQDILQPPTAADLSQWHEFVSQVLDLCGSIDQVHAYFSSLAQLQEADSLEEITRHHIQLTEQAAENSLALWQDWLRIQPAKLSAQARRILGDYSAVLELITGAQQQDRRVESGLMRRYYELFPKVADVLPCWAVTSLSARGRLPLEAATFDLLVIDEASQCDIASALPLLYRSKRAVIIGDPQQLGHISALRPDKDQQLLTGHGLEDNFLSWSYSAHSLFDLASSVCNSEDIVALRDHHRSHAGIIGFSNEYFYDGKLRIATDYKRLRIDSRNEPAIRWLNLKGHTSRPPTGGGAVNEEEAQAVVKEIKRLLRQGYGGSIGVVSPFRAQANRIRDILSQNGDLTQQLIANDCLIDTVHRFQGDERDLMIFSPAVAQGITTNALRFLSGNGTLFNVAITRARSTLIVVGDKSAAASSGVDYLERFVNYVDDLAQATGSLEASPMLELGAEYPIVSRPERVSDWERYFYKALYRAGHRPIPQYTVDQYDLDFALIVGANHRLDIEVDGERYHRNWDGELCRRDQIRNQRLMELGWDVMRFWVYEIRDDLERCIARVNDWVAKHNAP